MKHYIIKFGCVPDCTWQEEISEIENEYIREAIKDNANFYIDQLFIYGHSIEIMCYADNEVCLIVAFQKIVENLFKSSLGFEIYEAGYMEWKPTTLDDIVKTKNVKNGMENKDG